MSTVEEDKFPCKLVFNLVAPILIWPLDPLLPLILTIASLVSSLLFLLFDNLTSFSGVSSGVILLMLRFFDYRTLLLLAL